ncbi:alpha/beta fold hydrolase [Ideonella livida]|uniref:Alpha/beta hydrolase n=1 Tax=Ideonella livida TaxID=2707176 RepID=A0A7C9PJY4_9BURK|nr:alpha/beta hydrolase [Ideonella livida]NDY93915.1 alpha/beta hydrolase [Ideonella livida]
MSPVSRYLSCAGRELHVMDWGDPSGRPVIAWHGLARTGRDMDDLAEVLASQGWRVLCPDTLGRGLSQWSPEPDREYCLDFYVRLAVDLLAHFQIDRCQWVGTSMGGAIGLRAAAGPLRGIIERLVLNDMGPELAAAAVQRIRTYAGNPASFATVSELEQYLRTIYAPYGWLSDTQWRRMAETSVRRLPDGRVTPHYDPAMVRQFINHPEDYTQWDAWDSLTLPVLCLRGESSDLLLPHVAQAMRERGPRATVVDIPGCGHAPALNVPAHWALIEDFLRQA